MPAGHQPNPIFERDRFLTPAAVKQMLALASQLATEAWASEWPS